MSDYLHSLFRFDKFCFMSWKQFLMWDDHTVGQATCVEVWGIWSQVPSIHVKRVGSGDLCVPRQWIASHLNWMVGSRFCLKLWGGEYLRSTLMLTFGLHRQIAHMLHTYMHSVLFRMVLAAKNLLNFGFNKKTILWLFILTLSRLAWSSRLSKDSRYFPQSLASDVNLKGLHFERLTLP